MKFFLGDEDEKEEKKAHQRLYKGRRIKEVNADIVIKDSERVRVKKFNWKRKKMCDDCPFMEEGKGLFLRQTLGKGRWDSILLGLRKGEHFLCHKTTSGEEDDEGNYRPKEDASEKMCAGAMKWQEERGITADAVQVLERLEQWKERLG